MKQGTLLSSLFRGLTISLASVLTLGAGLAVGAKLNESDINSYLGTSNRVVVPDADATYKSSYDSWQDMVEAKHANIKAVAQEGIVLLKNNGVLPLKNVSKLNIFGRNSESAVYGGGGGAGQVTDPNCINVKTAFNNAGIEINDTLYNYYSTCEKRKTGGRLSDTFCPISVICL